MARQAPAAQADPRAAGFGTLPDELVATGILGKLRLRER